MEQKRIFALIDPRNEVKCLGNKISGQNFRCDTVDQLKIKLIDLLIPVEKILDYEFRDKNLLLEAFTHPSFMEKHNTGCNYEKLEVLGDAILDYVANSNLIKFTMFEQYNVQERLNREFIT